MSRLARHEKLSKKGSRNSNNQINYIFCKILLDGVV